MSKRHGQFCWCDLTVTDNTAAATFYRNVIGWRTHVAGAPHVR